MDKLITAILFIGIPMALTQLIYRIIDRKGNKTAKLAERFPVLVKRKFLVHSCSSGTKGQAGTIPLRGKLLFFRKIGHLRHA